MGTCYKCGKEFTLKEEEIKCDSCGEIVNYPCWSCKQWIDISKTKLCKTCGFYYCTNCGVCGDNCQKGFWCSRLKDILGINIGEEKLQKILDLIEEIKIGKERRCCPHGVSISYAKGRIKSCIVRTMGYRIKSPKDQEKFNKRINELRSLPLGKQLTVNQSREAGSYGQEYRDVFNYLICCGEFEKKIIKKGDIEYEVFERCEKGDCQMLDLNKLIIKVCTNPKCKIKEFPLSQTQCCDPNCRYKKGNKKGQFFPLKLKISNKDICQLNRGDFKRDEKTNNRGTNKKED